MPPNFPRPAAPPVITPQPVKPAAPPASDHDEKKHHEPEPKPSPPPKQPSDNEPETNYNIDSPSPVPVNSPSVSDHSMHEAASDMSVEPKLTEVHDPRSGHRSSEKIRVNIIDSPPAKKPALNAASNEARVRRSASGLCIVRIHMQDEEGYTSSAVFPTTTASDLVKFVLDRREIDESADHFQLSGPAATNGFASSLLMESNQSIEQYAKKGAEFCVQRRPDCPAPAASVTASMETLSVQEEPAPAPAPAPEPEPEPEPEPVAAVSPAQAALMSPRSEEAKKDKEQQANGLLAAKRRRQSPGRQRGGGPTLAQIAQHGKEPKSETEKLREELADTKRQLQMARSRIAQLEMDSRSLPGTPKNTEASDWKGMYEKACEQRDSYMARNYEYESQIASH